MDGGRAVALEYRRTAPQGLQLVALKSKNAVDPWQKLLVARMNHLHQRQPFLDSLIFTESRLVAEQSEQMGVVVLGLFLSLMHQFGQFSDVVQPIVQDCLLNFQA